MAYNIIATSIDVRAESELQRYQSQLRPSRSSPLLPTSNGIHKTVADVQQRKIQGSATKVRLEFRPHLPFGAGRAPRRQPLASTMANGNGGLLYNPHVFQQIVDIFVHRYSDIGIDVIAG